MQPDRFLRAVVFLIVWLGVLRIPVAAGPPQVAPVSPEPAAFREFTQRVQQYVKLYKTVPRLRTTKQPKEIVARRKARAQEIRETRSNAKPGDIFTPEVTEEFRRVIRSTFQGTDARNVRRTIREGVPLVGVHLSVNGDYPDRLPLTTVPPTLLLRLPRLPAEVAYRIIGHDFVLQDTQARLIVDFILGVVP
jgi:hypothetical protein